MTILNKIDIAFRRSKKNFAFTFVFVILIFFILALLTFKLSFQDYIDNLYLKNINFRTLSISPNDKYSDYGYEEIKKIEHVVNVHSAKLDYINVESSFKSENYDGYIDLNYGTNEIIPQNIIGRKFNEGETGVAICPIEFYPSSNALNLIIEKSKIIDGYNLLNSKFKIMYHSYVHDDNKTTQESKKYMEFEIIGLYDAKSLMLPANACYISEKDIKYISDINNNSFGTAQTIYGFMAIVDSIENNRYVIEKLNELGFFETTTKMYIEPSFYNFIITISDIMVSLILTILVFIIINFIKKKFINDKRYIGILLAIGYEKKSLAQILLFELILTELISYTIGIILYGIIRKILEMTLLKDIIFSGFKLILLLENYIIILLTFIFLTIILEVFMLRKDKNKVIVDYIKGEE